MMKEKEGALASGRGDYHRGSGRFTMRAGGQVLSVGEGGSISYNGTPRGVKRPREPQEDGDAEEVRLRGGGGGRESTASLELKQKMAAIMEKYTGGAAGAIGLCKSTSAEAKKHECRGLILARATVPALAGETPLSYPQTLL